MAIESIIREILPNSKQFKQFWKEKGPFKYALTSNDFPPVLLEPEEWIFSDDIKILLKELMQFDQLKMKVVRAPFNPANKSILRPENLSSWKINNFPEQWDAFICDIFVPQGYLTLEVVERIKIPEEKIEPKLVETTFFQCLENCIDQLGYLLLKPQGSSKNAAITTYLSEWEEDERDAGLL
ncbi:MAG: hypothetical protein H8D87_17210 [Deltaproteobacteria bacterium]|uniref:hypothetical protein n=1 Tax=Desulfobacula sp. TaxID=2593537 RepID=UPI0019A5F2F1|nr:hypothetical protein [Candidatus Desulfobacula maris]MBL6993980.1 hypothetical protein [Desulfobacula sp.]